VGANGSAAIGSIDSVSEGSSGALNVSGWSCVYGQPHSISVHLYVDGPAGNGGTYVTEVIANGQRESAVGNACGLNYRNFGYNLVLTETTRKLFANKKIYIHGISSHYGGGNELLTNSGKFSTGSNPTNNPPGISDIESFVPTGFDPGLKKRLASGYIRDSKYFEDCPDSPTGQCYNTLNPGSGFYTLPGNQADAMANPSLGSCKVNSGEIFKPVLSASNSEICPFYFKWGRYLQTPFAEIKIDTIPYTQASTINNYHGLHTTLPIGNLYGGLNFDDENMTPKIDQLETIEFNAQGKICYGNKKQDGYQFGRYVYYLGFWNVSLNKGFTVAFDYMVYFNSRQTGGLKIDYIQRQSDFPGSPQTEDLRNTFYVNGYQYGISNPNGGPFAPVIDTSIDCSQSMDNDPWFKVRLPIKSTIQNLLSQGFLSQDLVQNAKYTGSIIAGVETWGRSQAIVRVRNHSLYKTAKSQIQNLPVNGIIPEGAFRISDDGAKNIFYSNGKGDVCRFLTYNHAGIYDNREVSILYSRLPTTANPMSICAGGSSFSEIARLQEIGVYPEGQFRVLKDGKTYLFYSNGIDAYCRFVNLKQANIQAAEQITKVYDFEPKSMRKDPFCPGYKNYLQNN
jgi:hypothetical protein